MLEDKHDLSVGEFDSMPKMHYFLSIPSELRCLCVNVGLLFHYFHLEGEQKMCDAKKEGKSKGNERKVKIPVDD